MVNRKAKVVIFLIVVTITFQALVKYKLDNDPKREEVEAWLFSKVEIASLVGERKVVKLNEKTHVYASSEIPAYERYTFHIIGSKGAVLVSVLVRPGKNYELDRLVIL